MRVSGHVLRGSQGGMEDREQNVLDEWRHDSRRVANSELKTIGSCPFPVSRRVNG